MTLIWIGVALLVAAVTFVLLKKPAPVATSAPRRAAVHPGGRTPAAIAAPNRVMAAATTTSPAPTPLPMPPELADFHLQRADDLPDARKQTYAATFRDIPRPPRLLDHLLSPGFVNAASSTQLVDLITAEPLIAARVLTTINSPTYGLKSPVTSIGQAVTYLGLNTVRSLCLQYILIAAFKPDSNERKKMIDAAWRSSALASELTQRLAQRLGFEERGAMVSAVVLSFLGRLATTASVSRDQLAQIAAHGLLGRAVAEQKVLGLGSSQIGRLLMLDWGLPAAIVEDASDIDLVLVLPGSAFDAERAGRLALCYVCARLGERLAEGHLADLMRFQPNAEGDAEFFHFRGYLAATELERLLQFIRSPELDAIVQQMRATLAT